MSHPTQFELDILHTLFSGKSENYSKLKQQITIAQVTNRKYTGAGCYIYFYIQEKYKNELIDNEIITSNFFAQTDIPPSGLGFALNITDGKLDCLELFTFGDEKWDGRIDSYKITDASA